MYLTSAKPKRLTCGQVNRGRSELDILVTLTAKNPPRRSTIRIDVYRQINILGDIRGPPEFLWHLLGYKARVAYPWLDVKNLPNIAQQKCLLRGHP